MIWVMEIIRYELAIRDDVDRWTDGKLPMIIELLNKQRTMMGNLDYIFYGEVPDYFRTSNRSLSEMPLCRAIKSFDSLPADFCSVACENGEVYRQLKRSGLEMSLGNHAFAIGPEDYVLCFVPGLFESWARNDLLPGERLAIMKEKAPELITLYPDDVGRMGIARLLGTKAQIEQQLGLFYETI